MATLSVFTSTNITKPKPTPAFHLIASRFLDNTTTTSLADPYIALFNILFEQFFR